MEISKTFAKDADNYHYFSYDEKSGTSGISIYIVPIQHNNKMHFMFISKN